MVKHQKSEIFGFMEGVGDMFQPLPVSGHGIEGMSATKIAMRSGP